MARIVQKFGGSSVADAERLRIVADRIETFAKENELIVVLSAQGKTTDGLVAKADEIWHNGAGERWAREMDQLLSCGEQISVALCALELLRRGFSCESFSAWQMGLLTSDVHLDATPLRLLHDRMEQALADGKIVIATGFQGINAANDLTTLGRGGSDTTAVALSYFLKADRCQIFTDVDGVYDADPNWNPNAKKFKTIGYDEMLKLAENGAKVLHDRCVRLAKEYGIPIEVRSTFSNREGTVVMGDC